MGEVVINNELSRVYHFGRRLLQRLMAPEATAFTGVLLVLSGSVLVGLASIFFKLAVQSGVDVNAGGFYRMLIGSVVFLVLRCFSGKAFRPNRRAVGFAILAGVFFSVDLSLWHRSIVYVGPGMATLLGNLQVFFLAAFTAWAMKIRLPKTFFPISVLAMAGLYLLVGPQWREGPAQRLGVIMGVVAALSYVGYILTLRSATMSAAFDDKLGYLAIIAAVTGLLLAGLMFVQGSPFRLPDLRGAVYVVCYGFLSHVCGWLMITLGLNRITPARTGLLMLVQPVAAYGMEMLLFDRLLTWMQLVGAVITLASIGAGNAVISSRKEN